MRVPTPREHAVGPALRLGALGAGLLVSLVVYTTINLTMADTLPTRVLPTAIDGWVPFQPAWIVVYLGIYALAITPACLLTDRRYLARGALAYLLLLLSGVPFWVFWPVTVPRSPVPVTDLFTWGVALMRFVDPPANCLPSMHVGETVLAALLVWPLHRRAGLVIAGLAAMVWWSTLALDQHWFVDGLAVAIAAVGAWFVAFRVRPLPESAHGARSLRWLAWAGLLYAAQFLAAALPWWLSLVPPEAIGAVSG